MPAASGRSASGPLWLLLGVVGVVSVLWHLAVTVAGLIVGTPTRPRLQESLAAMLQSPFNPLDGYGVAGLPPGWLVWPVFLVGLALVVVGAWQWRLRRGRRSRRDGMGTPRQLKPYLGEAAARRLAAQTRPRMQGRDTAPIEDAAVPVGVAEGTGQRLYASHEDSFAVVAGPRSLKTSTFIVDSIRTGPGAVVAVSTKADLLAVTYRGRRRRGRVWVFDPTDVVGWPTGLHWSLVAGCEDPEAAMARAEGFVAAIPKDNTTKNSDFFESQARDTLRCFLHAAALVGADMREVIEWCYRLDSPTLRAREILRTHPAAAPLYALELEALTSGDAKEGPLDSTKKTLTRLMAPFASPRLLEAVCPPAGTGFDVDAFIHSTDTLYVMTGDGATVAPLITAFVNEVLRVARRRSQRLTPARLDPPLRVTIDEVGNCPLPELPAVMSDSGGRGVTTIIGSQGLGQARKRWGVDGADEVFGSATAKIIMGGTSEPDFLEKMSQLADEVEVAAESTTTSQQGGSSTTTGTRSRRVIRPGEIRQLSPGSGLLLYRSAPPVVVTLVPYWESDWADEAKSSQEQVAAIIAGTAAEGRG